jgi:hypothetical protein
MTVLLTGVLVPVSALLDLKEGLYSRSGPGRPRERSTRLAVLTGLLAGVGIGTAFGPLFGAASLLDAIQGRHFAFALAQTGTRLGVFAFAFVQVGTRLGVFIGGIVGAVEFGRAIYRHLPEQWREKLQWARRW